MKLKATRDAVLRTKTEALLIPLFKGSKSLPKEFSALDKQYGGAIGARLKNDFNGSSGDHVWLYASKAGGPRRVILWGLGEKSKHDSNAVRLSMFNACGVLAGKGVSSFSVMTSSLEVKGLDGDVTCRAAADGCLYSAYKYNTSAKIKTPDSRIQRVAFHTGSSKEQKECSSILKTSESVMLGVTTCRDLQNEPGNIATPSRLASCARQIAKKHGLKFKAFDKAQMKKLGMGGVLGVNQGSTEAPRFIIMEYKPKKSNVPTVVLVGKGLTFDTGGISLKPGAGMGAMKMDMSGGSAVIGAMHAIGMVKPNVHVVGLVPSTDNMPDGNAIKPGDILKSYGGKTIEVLNTDAEGRLILADALGYAKNYKPDAVVDMATLTGACVVALGQGIGAAMGNSEKLVNQILAASKRTDEKMWELPLPPEYACDLKSDVADVKNITGHRWAGSITAGLFLQEFVDGYNWVHLDIAGPAMRDKPTGYYNSKGTGFPVRALVDFVCNFKK